MLCPVGAQHVERGARCRRPSPPVSPPSMCLSPHAGCLFSDTLLKSNMRLLLISVFNEWWPSADIISISKFSPSVSRCLKWCLHRLYVVSVIFQYYKSILPSLTWKSLYKYTFISIRPLSTHYRQSALNLIRQRYVEMDILCDLAPLQLLSAWHRCRKYKSQIYNNLSDVMQVLTTDKTKVT